MRIFLGIFLFVLALSYASLAQNVVILNTTLENTAAVSSPVVGTGTGSSVSGATFIAGFAGNGAQFTASGAQYIRFQQTDSSKLNVNLQKGAVEFWYRPSYNHNDGAIHTIFSTGSWNTPGTVSLLKRGGSNELSIFIFPSPSGIFETNVAPSAYSWTANQWVRIKVTWDTTITGQMLRIYINGVEPAYNVNNAIGPVSMPPENPANHIYVGTRSATDTAPASGVIDELVIWGTTGTVTTDTTPPAISNIRTGELTHLSVTINWTTDDLSTSVVEYSTDMSFSNSVSDSSFLQLHSMGLVWLQPSTTYNYRVKSTNPQGLTATSSAGTFTTAPTPTWDYLTDNNVHLPPQYGKFPPPPVGSCYRDPTFGARICRISPPNTQIKYSRTTSFNADSSCMIIGRGTGELDLYCEQTSGQGDFVFDQSLTFANGWGWAVYWDRNNPDVIYQVQGGVRKYTISTGQLVSLPMTPSLPAPPAGASSINLNDADGEQDLSDDGCTIGLRYYSNSGTRMDWYFLYNVCTQTRGPIVDLSPYAHPDHMAQTHTPNLYTINWNSQYNGQRYTGKELWDMSAGTFIRQLGDIGEGGGPHEDPVFDALGNDAFMHEGGSPALGGIYGLGGTRLDGTSWNIQEYRTPSGAIDWSNHGGHVSGRHFKNAALRDWGAREINVDSLQKPSSNNWHGNYGEIQMIRNDPNSNPASPTIRRFAHHRSVILSGWPGGQAFAGTDMNGKYIAFESNFGVLNDANLSVYVIYLNPPAGDVTPPSVSITQPSGGATVSGTITVAATASDNVAVAGVQFKADGINVGAEDTTAPYSTSLDTTALANGNHVLTATARDNSNNFATSLQVPINVNNAVTDTTPPTITNVAAGSVTSSGATISWTTNEQANTSVRYGLTSGNLNLAATLTGLRTSHSVPLSSLSASTQYFYQVTSCDAAGNCASSSVQSFTTTATAPTQCSDGTLINTCSITKPKLCNSAGQLVDACGTCGCPGTDVCSTGTQTCSPAGPTQCSDGTPLTQCSVTKPDYCDANANLVAKCTICGCPAGRQCNAGTDLCLPVGQYNRLTFSGRLIRNNQQQTVCSSCTLTVGVQGTTNTTTTAADGSFSMNIDTPINAGTYLFDIMINDGTKLHNFKKRATII